MIFAVGAAVELQLPRDYGIRHVDYEEIRALIVIAVKAVLDDVAPRMLPGDVVDGLIEGLIAGRKEVKINGIQLRKVSIGGGGDG